MASVQQQQQSTTTGTLHPKFVQSTSPQCRVIVDEVDDERLHPSVEDENSQKTKTEEPDSENTSGLENPLARIKRFQFEAESRKIEFARLLEEHAQVIRRLKQMEESQSTHHFSNKMASVSKA